MAITHKDINLLSQKSTIAGTEKIPVSATEYVTLNQISGLVTVPTISTNITADATSDTKTASPKAVYSFVTNPPNSVKVYSIECSENDLSDIDGMTGMTDIYNDIVANRTSNPSQTYAIRFWYDDGSNHNEKIFYCSSFDGGEVVFFMYKYGWLEQVFFYDDGSFEYGAIITESSSNKVTSLSSASTNSQYPSAKCVYDMIGNIETLLAAI